MLRRNLAMLAFLVCVSACLCSVAAAKEKGKPKAGTQIVDSGSFGVFSSGVRVATETFSIEQDATGSVITSKFKSAQGEQVAEQSSELQLTPSTELRKYVWKEVAPEKTTATVVPNDAFLVETYVTNDTKTHDQNFLLPASTSIVDDYFFIQREVLAWKYLASACKAASGALPSCPMHQKTQFGALNPHARTSLSVAVEFAGSEKVTIHGTEVELGKFLMTSDTGDWAFWLNDKLRLVRLLSDAGIEVVRD